MAPLIKGMVLGLLGAVLLAPLVLILALVGIPIFLAGAIVVGLVVAIPLLIVAAVTVPALAAAGAVVLGIAIALLTAVKVAIWVVVPVVLIVFVMRWWLRASEARRVAG